MSFIFKVLSLPPALSISVSFDSGRENKLIEVEDIIF